MKYITLALLLFTTAVQSDEISDFKDTLDIAISKKMAEAGQHARCYILADTARSKLLANLHYAHGTYVLKQDYFDSIAKEEKSKLPTNLSKSELEMYAYKRYNSHCKHLHLGRPE